MNDFTASNGAAVSLDEKGRVVTAFWTANEVDTQALREFFQAEADERLGRWRWPENPDIYVCGESVGFVTVVDENDPAKPGTWERHWHDARNDLERAGVAYFAAHPEPKPWHDAVEGEVWILMFCNSAQAWFVNGDYFQSTRTLTNIAKTDEGILAGRRIFPEEVSS